LKSLGKVVLNKKLDQDCWESLNVRNNRPNPKRGRIRRSLSKGPLSGKGKKEPPFKPLGSIISKIIMAEQGNGPTILEVLEVLEGLG